MKKIILLVALLTFGLISCKTTDTLLTNVAADGAQVNFLRPFSVDTENKLIEDLSMDFTLKTKNGEILNNPTLNYTFRKKVASNIDVENVKVGLICGDTELFPFEMSLLYKNVAKEKYLEIRKTSSLDKEIFKQMLDSSMPWSVFIIYADGTKQIIDSPELNDRLLKLKIIL